MDPSLGDVSLLLQRGASAITRASAAQTLAVATVTHSHCLLQQRRLASRGGILNALISNNAMLERTLEVLRDAVVQLSQAHDEIRRLDLEAYVLSEQNRYLREESAALRDGLELSA